MLKCVNENVSCRKAYYRYKFLLSIADYEQTMYKPQYQLMEATMVLFLQETSYMLNQFSLRIVYSCPKTVSLTRQF